MAQAADNQIKNDHEENYQFVWPSSLMLNQTFAEAFSCVKCKGIPKNCVNDENGLVLCGSCSKNIDKITPSKAVQTMINKLKTKCLSIIQNDDDNNQETEGAEGNLNVISTGIKNEQQCEWVGKIEELEEHIKQCPFIMVECGQCKLHKCKRQYLEKHHSECPEVVIECPLLCGSSILRKNKSNHISNDCAESLLDCNNDDCKEQVKRKNFSTHINTECECRMVACTFVKYGCNVKNIKANELEKHIDEYKFDHISKKFDYITNQFSDKVKEQKNIISALKESNDGLKKELDGVKTELNAAKTELNTKINAAKEELNNAIQENKEPEMFRNVVHSNGDTGMISTGNGTYNCLIEMTLPQKAGKYVCSYSSEIYAHQNGSYWIRYGMKMKSGSFLSPRDGGIYLHKNYTQSYSTPVSGTVIVQLNGNEAEGNRKLGFYNCPYTSYPSRVKNYCLECYQIE